MEATVASSAQESADFKESLSRLRSERDDHQVHSSRELAQTTAELLSLRKLIADSASRAEIANERDCVSHDASEVASLRVALSIAQASIESSEEHHEASEVALQEARA